MSTSKLSQAVTLTNEIDYVISLKVGQRIKQINRSNGLNNESNVDIIRSIDRVNGKPCNEQVLHLV